MAERFEYRFEWDPDKAASNLKEHGVSFEQAAAVFLDPRNLIVGNADAHGKNFSLLYQA